MSEWLEILNKAWPMLVGLSSLFAGVVGLWLSSRFASKAAVEAIVIRLAEGDVKLSTHDLRIAAIETALESAPTRQELQEDIAQVRADIAALKAGFHGIETQLRRIDDYLHTLVERGLK